MRKLLLFLVLSLAASISWAGPFDEDSVQTGGQTGVTTIPTHEQTLIPTPEPKVPADGLASATPDGRAATGQLKSLLEKFREYLAAKDYKRASEAAAYITRLTRDSGTGKNLKPGIYSRMNAGGVHPSVVNELKGGISGTKSQMYSEMSAAILKAANTHKGYDTSKGPGGGDVACAWFTSIVLRAAGVVPAGWNENVAVNLSRRLVKEMGWSKVPPNGNPDSGKIKKTSMKPGDIVFWSPSDHVGIYLGNGMALSNSSSDAESKIHPVAGYYDGWVPRYVVRPPGN